MTTLLVIGMPASGKSTYIGALRHLLVADEVPAELALAALAEDEAHLNRLEEEWLSCRVVQRTKPATEGWVKLKVRDRSTGAEATLTIPDMRGEAFEQPAVIGQCQKDLHDALMLADGILLFTNADHEDDTLMIDSFGDMFPDQDDREEECGEEEVNEPKPFKPENMPEEVKIVEFLQVANCRPQLPRLRKIAVIASAWDVIDPASNITPETWLKISRPMLEQFLAANSDLWDPRIYGISAQGGKLPDKKEQLERVKRPSERVRVVGHEASPHDLTAPLRWLMVAT